MPSFWAKIVYAFGFVTLSPTEERDAYQISLPGHQGHNRPAVVDHGPPKAFPGPIFAAPEGPEWAQIKCDYSNMFGYTDCSTDGERGCWLKSAHPFFGEDFNITSDYENRTPVGVLRKYTIEVGYKEVNPDGHKRKAMVINGDYPGPWIQACWGDDIEVTVINKLDDNGTTIHWHGLRQLGTSYMDGVNGITQCPIAPRNGSDITSYTYRFKAQQYGTTWYHSHYSLQYGEGVLGPLTIHGPQSADYDHAHYPVMMTDWAHTSFFTQWARSIFGFQKGVKLDNVLLNGTGFPPIGTESDVRSTDLTAQPYVIKFRKYKRYLLRLINTSVESTFVFSIDNHKFEVVMADLVPIKPYFTDHVVIGIGQRYHVIVHANPINGDDPPKSYYIRTEIAEKCDPGGLREKNLNFTTGTVRYIQEDGLPDESQPDDKLRGIFSRACRDEPYDKLIPMLPWKVGQPVNVASDSTFQIGVETFNKAPIWPEDKGLRKWNIYDKTMWLKFGQPTIFQDLTNKSAWDAYSVAVPQTTKQHDDWIYLLISGAGIPRTGVSYNSAFHPIHLHGHDFAILEQSEKPFQLGQLNLKLDNPPRRDVAFMPGNGYLVIAFKADNPGVWLMHCHIALHASGGLAMQIVENGRLVKIPPDVREQMDEQCAKWDWHVKNSPNYHPQDDSGI